MFYLLLLLFFLILGFIMTYTSLFIIIWRNLKIIYNTLGRDIKALGIFLRTLIFVKMSHFKNQTVVDYFQINAEKYPNDVCFIFGDEEWTFKQVNDFSNKIATCFSLEEYNKGDEVALFMENCPEHVCMWLGLAKLGVITALINTNQKADSLAYSINVINTKAIIFGQNLAKSLDKAIPLFTKKDTLQFYCYTRQSDETHTLSCPFHNLNVLLDCTSSSPLNPEIFKTNIEDKVLYIYTSGTTGFPKPAVMRHDRILRLAGALNTVIRHDRSEIFYNPLPMYHTSGSLLYLTVVLIFGGKMVLRRKFSAENFWKEVVKHKVTVCQYIGEICRYLLNTREVPEETQHSVHLMLGNGLKPEIWSEFQKRFRIPRIIEVYGSTEGNVTLYNITGKVGAVGFLSRIFSWLYPIRLVRVDMETGELIRNKNGLCVSCKPGEPGEIVGKVEKNNPWKSFDGYVNSADTKKKIIRNCFKKGDTAFASGDILVMDEEGYVYFVDRTGDTFRWKGENVSTNEVEDIMSKILNHRTCVVYGVKVPGTEGRAGMAAIQGDMKEIDFEKLYRNITVRLPPFAVPLFLRICDDIESTGTFKIRKFTLRKEGLNPEEIRDPLYFVDNEKCTYIPLSKEIYSKIISGKLKL